MKRRIANIPMMGQTRSGIALCMHIAAEAMVLAPSSGVATEASKLLAIMTAAIDWGSSVRIGQRTDAPSLAIVAALKAMESIEARHDLVGALGVTGDEAVVLRAAAGVFDTALRRIPFNVYEAARLFVEEALRPATKPEPVRTAGSNQGAS